jgi:uncharacterized protein YjcR
MPAHKGSRHHLAVLTEDNVRSAREEYRKGSTIKELAEKYGISPGAMRRAVNNITWQHVGGAEVTDAAA